MQLTTKQKFSLIFSIYVFLFITLAGAIFFLALHILLVYQIQKDVSIEASNALRNHIAINKEAITVIKDKNGDPLSDEVIETNVSVLLLDNDLKVIKGYGLLELYNLGDQESVKIISKIAKDAQTFEKSYTNKISWRGQNLSVYIAPIKNGAKNYGTIVAAKSLSQVESLEGIIFLILIVLSGGSSIASLFLSRLLVGKIFKPIKNLTDIISKTHLDKLEKIINISGPKSDDLVVLGDKFNEMIIRLKSMSEQQKEFLANVSHELKTPLSRAISSLDLKFPSEKDIRADLFAINDLMDKLMLLSRLKPGLAPLDKLSLNKVIYSCVEDFKAQAIEKKITLLINLAPDATILIPKEYAKVLMGNLLSNAIKYGQENSTVSIQTQQSEEGVKLTIIDQGYGISKSDLNKVEKRFYRGKSSTTAGGYGIGLSIVRRIVDLYKIHFSIKSEAGFGTETTLTFPIT